MRFSSLLLFHAHMQSHSFSISNQCPVFLTNLEGKVGKVGKVGEVGKVGRVGKVGKVGNEGKEGRLRE